jgi:hypothetical protein
MNIEETAFSVRKTVRLVKEYEKIIDEYNDRNYILAELLNLEIFRVQLKKQLTQWYRINASTG